EDAYAPRICAQQLLQLRPAGFARRIDRSVLDGLEKSAQLVLGYFLAVDVFGEVGGNALSIVLDGEGIARGRDDARTGNDLAVGEPLQQRGQQLAPGQIAGAAENHQIKRVEGQRL